MGKVLSFRGIIPREWHTILPAELRTKPELCTPESDAAWCLNTLEGTGTWIWAQPIQWAERDST